MRSLLFVFLLLCVHGAFASERRHEEIFVRVRIATINASKIDVSGLGLIFQGEQPVFQKASLANFEHAQVELKDFAKKIWSYKKSNQSDDTQVKTVYSDFLTIEGENLQVKSDFVPSKIVFWAREPQKIDVIAVLNMDDYLKGVLPFEMPLAWPVEALKAQAVVARSFVLSQMKDRKGRPYFVDSTVNDQMYHYYSAQIKNDFEKLQKVLADTKGEILKGPNGVVKAPYHSDCGGQTEKASNVWGSHDLEVSVKDDFCNLRSPWKYAVTPQELKNKLSLTFVPQKLEVLSTTESHRAVQILVADTTNRALFSSQDFRRLVGYSKVRSTQFIIEKVGQSFALSGHGFGHGVGMCQWGASQWAKQGSNYKMILNHYFPGYKVVHEAL